MTMYAYFRADRSCIAVNDAVWPGGSYAYVSGIEVYRNPNDLYWNGVGAGTRVDEDISAWPDYVEVGDTYHIYAPTQSSVMANFVLEGSHYLLDTSVEANIYIELIGKARAAKTIQVVNLAGRKAAKETELTAVFNAHLAMGCTSALGWVDCDDQAQNRVTSRFMQYQFFGLSTATDTVWVMFDKTTETHTYAQFVTLASDITNGFQAFMDNKKTLQNSIDAATTVAALDAIDLEVGWPS